MKTEPSCYSINDLEKEKTTLWDGVRNYQARNFMMKDMSVGDPILFYHSNTKPLAIVGIAGVSGKSRPEVTALDPQDRYFDPKSTAEKPIWYCVEVKFVRKFANPITLETIKKQAKLKGMFLIKKGMRLSVQPVTKPEFEIICSLK